MMRSARSRKGQEILDYAVLLALVLAALLIMGYYIRNSLSGKIRDAGDAFGQGELYNP